MKIRDIDELKEMERMDKINRALTGKKKVSEDAWIWRWNNEHKKSGPDTAVSGGGNNAYTKDNRRSDR